MSPAVPMAGLYLQVLILVAKMLTSKTILGKWFLPTTFTVNAPSPNLCIYAYLESILFGHSSKFCETYTSLAIANCSWPTSYINWHPQLDSSRIHGKG